MSEPNNNISSTDPEMEAAAAKDARPAKDECEFVVHTKHTCDGCFQQPILGKRYTSSVHSNFDLCARCFDAYSGPEIGLSEVMLNRDKKHSSAFVLKLKIDNGGDVQVRRINVSEIWGKSIAQLSFKKMMSIASSYAYPENKFGHDSALNAFIAKARATYIDEDGDKITMTSNKELEDSFIQVLKNFPRQKPFRITVSIDNESDGVCAGTTVKATAMSKRTQQRKIQPKAVKSPNTTDGKSQPTVRVTPQKFEKDFFIHARHTCDGCSKSPIIGTRYHATKIPDFDLCGACFEKYEGEDLDFKPEIRDRDRRMQQKWLKRQLRDSLKMPTKIADIWNKAQGDISDFLKELQESGGNIESATVHASPPCAGSVSDQEPKNDVDVEKTDDAEAAVIQRPPTPKTEEATVGQAPGSPTPSEDTSFLSDADGNGSIAEAIGRTLDVCVQAIEEAMVDEMKEIEKLGAAGSKQECSEKPSDSKAGLDEDEAVASAVDADAFSVASSMVSCVTDIVLKKMDDAHKLDVDKGPHAKLSQSNDIDDASTFVPSVVTGTSILKSEDDVGKRKYVEAPKVEDMTDGGDEWSILSDDKGQTKVGEDIASVETAGSAFINPGSDKSLSSVEPLSPFVLAKWDTELVQLHELGFLNDRMNVDVLERLEASHVGVDSTEKVTVQNAVEHMLADLA